MKKNSEMVLRVGLGLVAGAALGVLIGVITGNTGLWIGVGAGTGLAFSLFMQPGARR
ncbi:MAG: hypothetical protein JXN59_19375 [Anaerolineae bacterium]|nr:hypothetical protein [Anaerolineae bacterium]